NPDDQVEQPGNFQNGAADIDYQAGSAFSWEASEFVAHEKSLVWYGGLIAVAAVFAAGLAWFRQWIAIAMVAAMTLAVISFSRKQPRILQYSIDDRGISINGKLHDYDLFTTYSLQPQVGWREIDFEPSRRFSQRLTVLCEDEAFDQIEAILSEHLPRVDRNPDFIEKLTRYLKF
ncbi:MAG TPA: hypothetical protein VMR98_00840, partial [Candidatus Polarisedimenticolaceae bacterium]|nr:hypothetical protein [Candidatus Polarisedimenticolaceae bacterium]